MRQYGARDGDGAPGGAAVALRARVIVCADQKCSETDFYYIFSKIEEDGTADVEVAGPAAATAAGGAAPGAQQDAAW